MKHHTPTAKALEPKEISSTPKIDHQLKSPPTNTTSQPQNKGHDSKQKVEENEESYYYEDY